MLTNAAVPYVHQHVGVSTVPNGQGVLKKELVYIDIHACAQNEQLDNTYMHSKAIYDLHHFLRNCFLLHL